MMNESLIKDVKDWSGTAVYLDVKVTGSADLAIIHNYELCGRRFALSPDKKGLQDARAIAEALQEWANELEQAGICEEP